jgi:serine/threonine protein kinase/Flp pilus assembly protein TadD
MNVDAARVRSIFLAAVENHPPQRWATFLDEACAGDDHLRRRVEVLLRAHAKADSLLDNPLAAPLTTAEETPVPDSPGTVIGPYKLLQPIGEGGMGTVYMAQQQEPVRRLVALKIIKPGMDTRQVIARFEAERQALALMDHPNIARVLDAGATAEGRPHFVMELVKGVPITRYCDEHHLTPRQRLELFLGVCAAVQHAHQKGVIHRDLKPSNVLVAEYDEAAVAKVIDFGIAKATGPRLTERTLFTEFGQVVGTLEYMSPEQAKLNALDIDTRSDIYALGVLLYELLTGTTPFERKRLQQAAFDEVLRIIREEEPPKPSTRLSTTDELPAIAARRGLEPGKLSGVVRGELDWIVMKCLDKDRNRRYETANGLARDLERYLHDEPVLACPPSAWYRFRKFARRHKRGLATAALLGVLLFAGMVTLAVINAQTRTEYRRAEAEAGRAQDNVRLALQALDETILEVLEDQMPRDPEAARENQERLNKALGFYEQFARQNEADPKAQLQVGKAYHRAGQMHGQLGNYEKALAALDRAALVYEQQGALDPADPEPRFARAAMHTNKGDLLNNRLGQVKAAQDEFRKGIELIDPLLKGPSPTPDNRFRLADLHNNLGQSYWASGDPAEAVKYFRKAIELAAAIPGERADVQHRLVDMQGVANYHGNLALALLGISRLPEAEDELREAIALLSRARKEASAVAGYRRGRLPRFPRHLPFERSLGSAHNNLAGVLQNRDRSRDAEKEWGKAIDYYTQAVKDWPGVPALRRDLAHIERRFGNLLFDGKKRTEAAAHFRHSIDLFRALDAESPGVLDTQVELSESLDILGDLLLSEGDRTRAGEHYREALELREKVVKRCPGVAEPLNKLAWFLAACPDPRFRDPGRAVTLAKEATERSPNNGNFWNTLGVAQYRNGEWKAAVASLDEARRLHEEIDEGDWLFLAMAHGQLGDKQQARTCYDRAVKLLSGYEYEPEESRRFRAEAAELLGLPEKK